MKAKKNVRERMQETLNVVGQTENLKEQNQVLRQKIAELETRLFFSNDSASESDRKLILEQLRSNLETAGKVIELDLDDILYSDQCRKTFTPTQIRKRANSLLENGQMENLIVIETKEGFELEDGELSTRAAHLLVKEGYKEWRKLKAVPVERPQNQNANHRSLIHHRHSEKLNQLDDAEAILKELKQNIQIDLSDKEIQKADGSQELAYKYKVKQILGSIRRKLLTNKQFVQIYNELKLKPAGERQDILSTIDYLDTLQKDILDFFYTWQEDNINTFYQTSLPLVFISQHLKEAIRHRGLDCTLARMLHKIKDPKLQKSLTDKAIKNDWSKATLKQEIDRLKPDSSTQKKYEKLRKQITISDEVVLELSPEQKQELIDIYEQTLLLLRKN